MFYPQAAVYEDVYVNIEKKDTLTQIDIIQSLTHFPLSSFSCSPFLQAFADSCSPCCYGVPLRLISPLREEGQKGAEQE
jgi:hypothetical protein